jgi:hypothetical protein
MPKRDVELPAGIVRHIEVGVSGGGVRSPGELISRAVRTGAGSSRVCAPST